LLELIFPFCEDALGARVSLAINNGWSFVQFHRDCLDYFLPRRLYERLRQDRYHRLQAKGESFATYINRIKQAAAVLQIPDTEQEIARNIVEGLHPEQRSRFVFQQGPQNFEDLDQLAILDQNLAFADRSREIGSSGSCFLARQPNVQISPVRASGSSARVVRSSSRQSKTCFFCHKMGHLKKDCFRWREQQRKRSQGSPAESLGLREARRHIVGLVSGLPPKLEVQLGNLLTCALLDSGAARSLISHAHLSEMQKANPKLELHPVELKCVTASGQGLPICGQVWLPVRVAGFTWKFPFLVGRRLCGFRILGADFFAKTQLVLDVARSKCHFAFAPETVIKLGGRKNSDVLFQTASVVGQGGQGIRTGKLAPERGKIWLNWLRNIPMY
jgi:hypothetical protein